MKATVQTGIILFLVIAILALAGCTAADSAPTSTSQPPPTSTSQPPPTPTANTNKQFEGKLAFEHLVSQVDLGPRIPDTIAHREAGDIIIQHLANLGWLIEEQLFEVEGIPGRNIIAKANLNAGPVLVLGAHYDSRILSDRSPESSKPVPGAVDGASGVAVLMELARALDLENIENEIWLAFFDLEDQGRGAIPGLDFIEGSSYMAKNLEVTPEAVVVVDMVGDSDQQFYYEGYSDPELRVEIWVVADELGYGEYFIPELKHTIRDDHLPFLEEGIPAITILDFDYPYWHTIDDTVDKSHPDSLQRVGEVLQRWLEDTGG